MKNLELVTDFYTYRVETAGEQNASQIGLPGKLLQNPLEDPTHNMLFTDWASCCKNLFRWTHLRVNMSSAQRHHHLNEFHHTAPKPPCRCFLLHVANSVQEDPSLVTSCTWPQKHRMEGCLGHIVFSWYMVNVVSIWAHQKRPRNATTAKKQGPKYSFRGQGVWVLAEQTADSSQTLKFAATLTRIKHLFGHCRSNTSRDFPKSCGCCHSSYLLVRTEAELCVVRNLL